MNALPKILSLTAGLMAASSPLFAQATVTTPTVGTVPTRPTMPNGSFNPVRPTLPALPTEVQTLIRQFDAQRDALLAQRRAELARLQNATADERARILAEMQANQAQRQDEQRELARKIREELKALREARRNGGG